ncbi:MAG: hypothetical protein DRP08_07830, partial [Candidatus Aenigmatarchaeota archaeon]
MKKIGILLITIMLFSIIGVFDTVKADVHFDPENIDVHGYHYYVNEDDTLHGSWVWTSLSAGDYHWTTSNMYSFEDYYILTFSSSFFTEDGYYKIRLKGRAGYDAGSYPQLTEYFEIHHGGNLYKIEVKLVSAQTCKIYDASNGSVLVTHYRGDGYFNFDIIYTSEGVSIVDSEAGELSLGVYGSSSQKKIDIRDGGSSTAQIHWITYDYEKVDIKDFTSVEITSDKTHYDMTDTQAIFTVTVADADGPVTGCTIDETITLPDATTDTSLTWTDNGDGTYTSSPLTLDQYGMYQYECTVSKEGYNDGSDSGVFTRDGLTFTGEPNYENDGVHPDSGSQNSNFTFRIKYTDADNDPPTSIQLWLDEDL